MHQYSGVVKINLSALRRNWRVMRDHFRGRHCGAVVKANAYGLGVAPVVQSLYSEGCRHFFVATFDEAVQVKRLIPKPVSIFVLQGVHPGMEQAFCDEDLIPVIYSLDMWIRWRLRLQGSKRRCALKVNTGMNRLGFEPREFSLVLEEAVADTGICVDLVMSHLACADEPRHPMNRAQLATFEQIVEKVRARLPAAQLSLTNSAGIFLGGEWHFDVARPGIALYGGRCVPTLRDLLSTVVTVELPVLQVRDVSAGESIGYGGDFIAANNVRAAVVSGGYADGFLRSLSPRLVGWRGKTLPVLGRISMDSCVFDITHLAEHERPREGDMVEIIGGQMALDAAAEAAGTISYELLTRLGDRLQKIYFEEPGATL